jgi:hypothetical protein
MDMRSDEEKALNSCMWWFLTYCRNDDSNYYMFDFIEDVVDKMEELNVEEKYLNKLWKKYFNDKIEEIDENWNNIKR